MESSQFSRPSCALGGVVPSPELGPLERRILEAENHVRHPRDDGPGNFNAAWRDWIEAKASP